MNKTTPSKTNLWIWGLLSGCLILFLCLVSAGIGGGLIWWLRFRPQPYTPSPTATRAIPTATPTHQAATPSACNNDPIGCVTISPDEPIHIAYLLSVSGVTSSLGADSKGGIEIAIDDRGRELVGHDILLTGEDTRCDPDTGKIAAKKIASDSSIVGVIGTNCSSAAAAAMESISNAGLVMISPSNTYPGLTLTSKLWLPGYFRTIHSDYLQATLAAEFAYNKLGARTAATIHDDTPYSNQMQEVFAKEFLELGGKITYQGEIHIGDTDMRSALTAAGADSPDVLYFPMFEPEGDYIVAQSAATPGLENVALMSADGLLAMPFPENAGPNVVGMYLSGPYVQGDAYDAFLAKWKEKFGGAPPSGFHAFAYDATNILLDAIEKAAIVDSDGTLHIGRQALREAIRSTSGYQGLTGTLDCGDDNSPVFGVTHGDCSTGDALAIFQITTAELKGNWPPPAIYSPMLDGQPEQSPPETTYITDGER